MNDVHGRKPDEPRNPQQPSTAPASPTGAQDEPTPDLARPPDGYADPLRRERGSGLVDAPEPGPENVTGDGDDLETTVGDRGGAG